MADPLRAALRVVREHLTDDGFRALAHAMLDAALDELRDHPRAPSRRSPVRVEDDATVDELTAERARRNAARIAVDLAAAVCGAQRRMEETG